MFLPTTMLMYTDLDEGTTCPGGLYTVVRAAVAIIKLLPRAPATPVHCRSTLR